MSFQSNSVPHMILTCNQRIKVLQSHQDQIYLKHSKKKKKKKEKKHRTPDCRISLQIKNAHQCYFALSRRSMLRINKEWLKDIRLQPEI